MSIAEEKKLPKGWRWARLNDIAHVFTGSSAPQGKEYFDLNGPPFVRVSDLGRQKRTTSLTEFRDQLSEKALKECSLVLAKKGAILFPKSGAAITNNNRAILGVDAYMVSHLMAIEPVEDESISQWLYWALCQIDMMNYSDNDSYPSLKKSIVEKIRIPLPPLPEQKRIAAILNVQMEAVEKARAAAETKLEAAKALPAAYLRKVFPQQGQTLPEGWTWVNLGEVCEEKTGNRNPLLEPDKLFQYIDITSVDNNAKCILSAKNIIGKDAPSRARQVICAGDVIVSTTRPNLNAVAIVPSVLDNEICSTGFCVLRAKQDLDRNYLFAFVKSVDFVQRLSDLVKGALYPAVTDKQVRSQIIPLPPLPEQKRIATILNEQMTEAEKLRKSIGDELEAIKYLPSAMLRKAFNGEL